MKKRNRFVAIFTSYLLVISATSGNYLNAITSNDCQSKIDEELLNVMENSDESEQISVGVRIEDLDGAIINEMIEAESSYDTFLYQDIETYKSLVAPGIVKSIEEKYGFETAHLLTLKDFETDEIIYSADTYYDSSTAKGKIISDLPYDLRTEYIVSNVSEEAKVRCAEENFGMSYITKEISDDIDGYMKVRRSCVIRAYEAYNKEFISKYISTEQISTNVGFAPYLIIYANKETINEIANDEKVVSITHFVDEELTSSLSNSNSLTGVTAVQQSNYNQGSGYTGVGVKVGIIEAASGRYNSNYTMLNGCSNLSFINTNNNNGNTTDWHATRVTSIIKGKLTIENGVSYRGVAPDSIVYQTCCNYLSSIPQTIQALVTNGVSVINHSANLTSSQSYRDYDWWVDEAINNLGIVFVNSAGNNTAYIQSPAFAYDGITVGNLNCYNTTAPYSISDSSSYANSINTANKPDVVAPGTNIYFPNNGTDSGTSYSAPMVAGIVAQLIQCESALKLPSSTYNNKTYFNAVKACILIGADPNKISATDNAAVGAGSNPSLMRYKTGAGLVNVKNSIDILKNNGYYHNLKKIELNSNGTSPEGLNIITSYEAGEKVRAVLCFSRLNETTAFDMDLKLYDSNMNLLACSTTNHNNVEIIEYTIPVSGMYFLEVNVYSSLSLLGNETLPGALIYSETLVD